VDVRKFGKLIWALIVLLFWLGSVPQAVAGKRVALVIGNQDYTDLPDLTKALNDARSMRETLENDLGFSVIYGENLTRNEMTLKISDLENSIAKDDVVFVFYSGHGVAYGGENYMLPVDMRNPEDGQQAIISKDGFGTEELTLVALERGAKAIFAVIDACRNNPFRKGTKAIGGDRGLTKIDAADGVFVLFSAGLGQEALDRLSDSDPDPNSVFTRSLVPLLKTGGLSQVDIAKQLQEKVAALALTIGHVQKPAYYDQISGFVKLNDGEARNSGASLAKDPGDVAIPPTAPPSLPETLSTPQTTEEPRSWFLATFNDVDLFGQDLVPRGLPASSASECTSLCGENLSCRAYTYNYAARICFLKSGYEFVQVVGNVQSGFFYEGRQSDPPPAFQAEWEVFVKKDLTGDDLGLDLAASYKDCLNACNSKFGCTGLTYVHFTKPDRCWLKGGTDLSPFSSKNATKGATSARKINVTIRPDNIQSAIAKN
jgi:Caspase domain/PAN domain